MKWVVTTAATVVSGGMLVVFWTRLPPQVPLWYSRPWGEDQLARPIFLWLVPAVILALGIMGGLTGRKLEDWVLEVMLAGAIAGAQIILAVGLVRIIMLVV